jgi:diguanylate cyclase (GGDEF)-like protein
MSLRRPRLSLTGQVALLSLIPILALGFVLASVLRTQVTTTALDDASRSAQLLARIAVQPRLTPADLRNGLNATGVRELDRQLRARSATQDLARIKIWNTQDRVIYSDDHGLIGRTIPPSDDLRDALAGEPHKAEVVTPSSRTETASEVGLGQLVEVYVPLRFTAVGPPAGAFEIYLSYKPIAATISHDKRMIAVLVFCGLALLWAILFRIVARAARTLRRQAEQNHDLARYDQLTGLPNRTLFIEHVSGALARQGRSAQAKEVAVLLVDLEGFKEINDTLGHANGDVVLREVARRLRAELTPETVVARLGGDEYGILHPQASVSRALSIAARAQSSLEWPIEVEGVALNVEASVGLAVVPDHAEDFDTLLQRADVALGRAKSHRSHMEVYSSEHDHFDTARLTLLGQVRPALERGEFILHYQPKVDLRSGRTTGVEALLRWQHPERGLLPPSEFISLIEQTALIGPVTLYVVERALKQMAEWRKLGLQVAMSVNLSARNLLDTELPAQIEELMRRNDTLPQELTVEVTEGATMADPDRAVLVLEALRAMGVGISIDDFGTGHASIAYLTQLPANEIKIDKSFVTDICEDRRNEAIARSTIDLARHLDLRVVAEGIETREAWELLASLGCDTAQGYLISRPVSAEQLTAWLLRYADGLPAPATNPVKDFSG